MNKKRWTALAVAIALFIVSIAVNTLSLAAFGGFTAIEGEDTKWNERIMDHGAVNEKVVVLEINGVIQETYEAPLFFDTATYRHRTFLSMLEHAGGDPSVEGIIIRVNSPGGGVVESAEIHDKIVEVQNSYRKPVYISMGNMAASGGYYIAAPADKIIANPSTITGSLGVIFSSINVSELASELGIKEETIKSGPYKDIMSPTRDMLEEERAILQSMIDEAYDEFVHIIAKGRKMDESRVREIADGRIYSGRQALELNLVDQLGSYDSVIDLMRADLGKDYTIIGYESAFHIDQFFKMGMERFGTNEQDLLGIKQLLSETNSPALMYLYTR